MSEKMIPLGIGFIIGVCVSCLFFLFLFPPEYLHDTYQQGWCDGSHEVITANYDLWQCYSNFGDFFFINESRWNVSCYDENVGAYYDMGYRMADCKEGMSVT